MTPTLLSPEARGQRRPAEPQTVSLAARRTFSHPVAAETYIRLRHAGGEGHFWVTFEGQTTDHVLSSGQSLQFTGPGLLVVEALQAAARLRID
ncbi:MAG: hypothetical protein JWO82_1260 [Akkermansiaceae bacterium]|nr:hypothetical protein [Akkermansiaceae bacterium]